MRAVLVMIFEAPVYPAWSGLVMWPGKFSAACRGYRRTPAEILEVRSEALGVRMYLTV
jgi:hypothetical protein